MSPIKRAFSRLAAAFLSLPLRFKITLPYLVVAILLAGLATWVITQSFARGLQERFNARLVDGFVSASDAVFQSESGYLTSERAMARTAGMAVAVGAHDTQAAADLVRPLAVNAGLPLVHVVDTSGRLIYGLRTTAAGEIENETAEFNTWPLLQRVLAGESDQLGDKYSSVVDTPWGPALYVAGPVKEGEQLRGAVLVGAPLHEILPQMRSDSLARVTIYSPGGEPVATAFDPSASVPPLAADAQAVLNTVGGRTLYNRLFGAGPDEYGEAVGPLFLRGQATGWAIGVALPRSLLTESAQFSPLQLALVLGKNLT